MARSATRTPTTALLPEWVAPELTQLVDAAPAGDGWLHELKYDGYRMHARLDRGAVKLLTRTGLNWTHKYPAIAKATAALGARQASTANCAAWAPTASPCSTSSSSLPIAATQQRWSSSCSTLHRRRGSPAAAAVMPCA